MVKHKYKIGLVGALGTISDAHLDAIHNIPGFELRGVCDLDESLLMKKFGHMEDLVVTTDYKQLSASDKIDIIAICTPHHLHSIISIDALKRDKHVLCEKPMTISVEQSERILNALDKSDGVFVVSYHFEYFPEVSFMKNEIEQFGQITRFKFRSSEYLYPGTGWNYSLGTGGVWLDWAPNALSVLRKILAKEYRFESFEILDVRLNSSLDYEIETKAYVKLLLDNIEGELEIDWEGNEGEFIAETTFWNKDGDEIVLNHATNCLHLNSKKIWCGEDSRYRKVYEDFARRIESNSSNIKSGVLESKLINSVFGFS